jgi:hypothetical protein
MSYKCEIAGGILHQTYSPEASAAEHVFALTLKWHVLFGSNETTVSEGILEV